MAKTQPKSTGPTTKQGYTPKAGPKRPGARSRGGVAVKPRGEDLFTQGYNDLRHQAQIAQSQRELEKWEFRRTQATMATEHPWFKQLKPGTVAYRYAEKVIDCFPLADPPADRTKNRTQTALEAALEMVSDTDIMHEKAIRHGATVAQAALRWAYEQLCAHNTEQTA